MPTKKTKKIVKASPVATEQVCECGSNCRCHCHGVAHLLKHIIIWAIIFAFGMVCGKMMNCKHSPKHIKQKSPVFVNGCLDMQSITNQKFVEKVVMADANADECISIEEYHAWQKANKTNKKSMRKFRK